MADIRGTRRDDTLVGTSAPDDIRGRRGDDILRGLEADDTLSGARGRDTLEGGDGRDKLLGGRDADHLEGGADEDVLRSGPGADRLKGGGGNDHLSGGSGSDELFGGEGDDELDGSNGTDLLDGGAGSDELRGGPDEDSLFGRDGDDDLRGGGSNDELYGGTGDDVLDGGGGRDLLDGGFDDDILEGESGNDTLDGGPGIDSAVYRGRRADHEITVTEAGTVVRDLVTAPDPEDPDAPDEANDGTDLVINVERLVFTDIVTGPDGINGLPDVGPNVRIEVPRNAPGFAFDIGNPTDPDGDRLTLRIVETPIPEAGIVLRPDRENSSCDVPVELGERLDLALLVRTSFIPADGFVGAAGGFAFEADDGHGGKVVRRFEIEVLAPPPGIVALANLSGSDGFIIEGAARDDEAGIAVSATDLNGDGHPEILVGARSADPQGGESGRVYAIFGGEPPYQRTLDLGTLGASQGLLVDGEVEGDRAGISLGGLGDADGDGIGDLVLGARGSDRTAMAGGAAYLVYGDAAPPARLRLDRLEDGEGSAISGEIDGELVGARVAAAGDLDGDGLADAVIAAPGANPEAREFAGHAYVAFGAAERLAVETEAAPPSLLRIIGAKRRDNLAADVAAAGDIDGDGYDDLVLGVPSADPNGSGSGAAYIVLGGPGLRGIDTLDLDAPGAVRLLVVHGGTEGDGAGTAVAGAGDVNGDGFDDVLIGAPGADPIGSDTGEVYVVYGAAGIDDQSPLDVRSFDGVAGIVLRGVVPQDMLGTAVAGVGDTDGDGFDDILVAARDADPAGEDSGEAYVVFGNDALGLDGAIDLFRMQPDEGLVASGPAAGDRTGIALAALGDVDGNGLADYAIGAANAAARGLRSAGKTYIVLGEDRRELATAVGTAGDDTLVGTVSVDRIVAGRGDDTIAPGGGADVVYAGAGDDLVIVSDTGFRRLDGGAGTDTLLVSRAVDLDLSTVPRGAVREIEIFDLRANDSRLVTDPLGVAGLSPTKPACSATASPSSRWPGPGRRRRRRPRGNANFASSRRGRCGFSSKTRWSWSPRVPSPWQASRQRRAP